MDDDNEKKKGKGIKQCIINRRLTFKNYNDSLFNDTTLLKSQLRFKSDHHDVSTEDVNKIALTINDDKRLQTFYRVIYPYPYEANDFKVCEIEILSKIRV